MRNIVDSTRYALVARATCALVALGAVSPAGAQLASPQPAPEKAGLEEVVVTAQRREQSLQDVPVSVSAFSAAELESRGASSLSDLTLATPNMNFNSTLAGQYVRVRGVGATDNFAFFDPGVGIYVDGVYLPRLKSTEMDLVSVERVEVLRGPQGTLFGRNTIGGAINITTKRPSAETSGSLELITGSFKRLDALASVEGAIAPGVLSGRMAGSVRNRDGYADRINFETGAKTGEMSDQDHATLRGSLHWTPSEQIDALMSAGVSSFDDKGNYLQLVRVFPTSLVSLTNSVSDPDYTNAYVPTKKWTSYASGYNANKDDSWDASINVAWRLERGTLRSITSYRDQEFRAGIDFDASPLQLFEQDFHEQSRAFSQELQLSGLAFSDRLNYVAGVYYGTDKSKWWAPTYLFQPLYTTLGLDVSSYLTSWTDNRNAAAYTQGTFKISDKLSVTAGLRYSYDDKWAARQRARVNTPAVFLPYLAASDTWSAFSGRFGLEYSWNPDLMGYISVARGYKAGGINGSSANSFDMQPFDPELLLTYEIGVRSEWYERRLRVNASVFSSKYSDMQFRIPSVLLVGNPPQPVSVQLVGNVASASIRGGELEIVAAPTPGLQLSAAVGYLNARYTKAAPALPITTKDKFVDTPEWSVALSGQYSYPLATGAELYGRLDYSYLTEQQRWYQNTPYLVQPGYSNVNARLGLRSADGKWEVAAFGTNLTNEYVMTFGYDLRATINDVAQYGPPRQWGASIKYTF